MITPDTAQSLSEIHDLVKGFLNGTLKEIMARLEAERSSLFLFDPDRRELILDACYNPAHETFKGLRQRLNEGVSGKVIDLKTAVLVKDISHDSRFKSNGFRQYHTPSFISVPLYVNSSLIGVMHIADKSTGGRFTEADFDYTTTLCRYACTIVANLCSFVQMRKEKNALDCQKNLLQQYAAVGKLAQEIVHHINDPLDGTIRFANILLKQADEEAGIKEYLCLVTQGLLRIEKITSALREFGSRLGSTLRTASVTVDVHALLDETLSLFQPRLDTGGYIVKRQFQAGRALIPNHGLEHLFMNMIKNALDAMPAGGVLTISTVFDSGNMRIVFSDTGCGVPVSVRKLIFEPFFTTKPIGAGTGMGLAICKEVVEKYNGKICVESEQSESRRGTLFFIDLPLVPLNKG